MSGRGVPKHELVCLEPEGYHLHETDLKARRHTMLHEEPDGDGYPVTDFEPEELKSFGDQVRLLIRPVEVIVANRIAFGEVALRAARLRELGHDWDGEGAEAIDDDAIDFATDFVRSLSEMASAAGVLLPRPRVNPTDFGTVDLHWVGDDRTLLVNVEGGASPKAAFFGWSEANGSFSGEFGTDAMRSDILAWLTQ